MDPRSHKGQILIETITILFVMGLFLVKATTVYQRSFKYQSKHRFKTQSFKNQKFKTRKAKR